MTAPELGIPEPERRDSSDRRFLLDRRSGVDRRSFENADIPHPERRARADRRGGPERRAFLERRMSLQSAGDQIRGALKLLSVAIESGDVPDKQRRGLDAALLRLRFALERLENE